MKIALYKHHHHLPFWHNPKNPEVIFNPDMVKCMTVHEGVHSDVLTVLEDHYLGKMLLGLDLINLPIMAHVSMGFDITTKNIQPIKRIWVQISTLPDSSDKEIPVIVENNQVSIHCLWGGDNGTYSPLGLVPDDELPSNWGAEEWKRFFLRELKAHKTSAEIVFNKARDGYELYPATL